MAIGQKQVTNLPGLWGWHQGGRSWQPFVEGKNGHEKHVFTRGGTREYTMCTFYNGWSEVKNLLQKIASTCECSNATTSVKSLCIAVLALLLWVWRWFALHCVWLGGVQARVQDVWPSASPTARASSCSHFRESHQEYFRCLQYSAFSTQFKNTKSAIPTVRASSCSHSPSSMSAQESIQARVHSLPDLLFEFQLTPRNEAFHFCWTSTRAQGAQTSLLKKV